MHACSISHLREGFLSNASTWGVYHTFKSRVIMWVTAELHLMFAAFVLAVPMFAVIIEIIGYVSGDKRYDALAYEFTKLLSVSFSFTASLGAMLTFLLVALAGVAVAAGLGNPLVLVVGAGFAVLIFSIVSAVI
mgnify:CR=1 FL=1